MLNVSFQKVTAFPVESLNVWGETVETTRNDCSFTWDGSRSIKIAHGGRQQVTESAERDDMQWGWPKTRGLLRARTPISTRSTAERRRAGSHTPSCGNCSRTRGRPHPGVAALYHFSEQVILCLRSLRTKEYRGHDQRWRESNIYIIIHNVLILLKVCSTFFLTHLIYSQTWPLSVNII